MNSDLPPAPRDAGRGSKYLIFALGEEEYGLPVPRVHEIVGLRSITRIPRAPAFIRGVVNLRGTVIPVVDLRERFGMAPVDPRAAEDAQTAARAAALRCMVVVDVAVHDPGAGAAARRVPMGVVVDRVSEVADLDDAEIEDPRAFATRVRPECLLGVVAARRVDGRVGAAGVRLLLDVDRVLAGDESAPLANAA